MEERMMFISDVRRGELNLSALCRTYGISRKTGYKWKDRFEAEGVEGLKQKSRAPHRCPHAIGEPIEMLLLSARQEHPSWGPRKLLAWLSRRHRGKKFPAPSTVGDLLKRKGRVKPRRRRRNLRVVSEPSATMDRPNAVWCVDFKGQFLMGSGCYCYPLTISDGYSRYLLGCEGMSGTQQQPVRRMFERLFSEYGLPETILSDNGTPFASVGIGRLTRLSAWWVKLGIRVQRIDPGHPEQNGRHERMHRTLKQETTRPAAAGLEAQQAIFDGFRRQYNHERPHEALGQLCPADFYKPSSRSYPKRLRDPSYPGHYEVRRVKPNGDIHWKGGRVFFGEALSRESIGLVEVDEDQWQVYFFDLLLALYDARRQTLFALGSAAHPRRLKEKA